MNTSYRIPIYINHSVWLQHADSEGALPDEAHSIQSAASISTLGSSLGESEVEKPCLEEDEEEEQNDVGGRKNSLERVSPIDGQERRAGPQSYQGRLTLGEESDSDDILMEDDQVADFASSMLAAISCWHYRARALLSMGVTTVRLSATIGFPSSCFHRAPALTLANRPSGISFLCYNPLMPWITMCHCYSILIQWQLTCLWCSDKAWTLLF